jgi:hypothetical protein
VVGESRRTDKPRSHRQAALITVTALAIPEAKVEIQGYAVIGSK